MSARVQARFVIVRLDNKQFAIRLDHVQEMVIAPLATQVPGLPVWIRGVIDLRGQVLPLVDLRLRLGMESSVAAIEQFCSLMEQRERDHKNWLAELEASVHENRAFTLATDPHKCAFGKWYDTYKSEDPMISLLLKRFDRPHKAIHALAGQVAALVAKGEVDSALEVLSNARARILRRMIRFFEELRQLVRESQREVAIVLRGSSATFAVSVDAIEAIEDLAEENSIGTRSGTDKLTVVLETDSLIDNGALESSGCDIRI